MLISVRWLNEYLDPPGLTAEQIEHALTHAGFPIESSADAGDGDVRLDVEVTSNRGDALSHIGLAREVAAKTGRRLTRPAAPVHAGPMAPGVLTLDNRAIEGGRCRRFTARVIRAVRVGPSPAWLQRALLAIGQRPINNVVDVTNFVAAEYGQPTHVFDLATLARGPGGVPSLIVRSAQPGERLELLDGRVVELRAGELVVADATHAVSLAGIMGGRTTGVTDRTTDIVLEAATWDPATVRRCARRLQLRTEASHRFERVVDPRTIDEPAGRAAALIAELTGGTPLAGVLDAGEPASPPTRVRLRTERCRRMLGIPISSDAIGTALEAQGFRRIEQAPDACLWEVPAHRPDVTREIDLVEEVARTHGLDGIPIHEHVRLRAGAPQPAEQARHELERVLTGAGFLETVTFSFVTPAQAKAFLPGADGMSVVAVQDERRAADGALRPSLLPSLLACRKANQDARAHVPGGIRLFEIASVYAERASADAAARQRDNPRPAPAGPQTIETRRLALVADASPPAGAADTSAHTRRQDTLRLIRAVLDACAAALRGPRVPLAFEPIEPPTPAWEAGAVAGVHLDGVRIGTAGLLSRAHQSALDLATPVVLAEVDLGPLLTGYPPRRLVEPLPVFPSIERDLSLVLREDVPWSAVENVVRTSGARWLESCTFVGTWRGTAIGAGNKSVTLRLSFRNPERTLRDDEVNTQTRTIVERAAKDLDAKLRE